MPYHEIATRTRASIPAEVVSTVERRVRELCAEHAAGLPFHGWHHVNFVRTKGAEFAGLNGSDVSVVEVAALVHDVNYMVRRNSPAAAGRNLRLEILAEAGVPPETARWIDRIVCEAEMASRHRDISREAQALSDADTLFKALPVTPVVLAHRYHAENDVSLRDLATKIVGEQNGPYDAGFYFYGDHAASMYTRWAGVNLELWRCILEALDDPDVTNLLDATA